MRDILFTGIFIGLIGFAYRRAWAALLIWAWLSYMNPHRLCYGFAATVIPWTMIAAVITILGVFTSGERNRFPWTRETILLTIFCLWMVVTTYFGLNQVDTWDYLDRELKIQTMIFVIFLLMKSRFRLEAMVWVIVVSIGFWGVKGGVWTLLTGGGGHVRGPDHSMIDGNNEIALALVMILPLASYLQLHTERKSIRWTLVAVQVLCYVAVVGTYSRAGFLALCVMWFFQWWKSRHKLALIMALLLVAPPVLHFMPQEWSERMGTIRNTSEDTMDASAKGRLNAWRMGVNLVKARPILGGGFRTFIRPVFAIYAPDPIDVHDAHSIYVETLTEQGIPGFSMFMLLGLFTWLTGRRVMKAAKKLPELNWASDLVTQVLLGLAGYAVGGAFAGLAYWDLPYNLMSIVVICGILAKDAVRVAAWAEQNAAPVAPAFAAAAQEA